MNFFPPKFILQQFSIQLQVFISRWITKSWDRINPEFHKLLIHRATRPITNTIENFNFQHCKYHNAEEPNHSPSIF
ncbi:UNVERIFIED_CONTAM: hypothetical protein RMT77_011473 [Armadillidium vulgare]